MTYDVYVGGLVWENELNNTRSRRLSWNIVIQTRNSGGLDPRGSSEGDEKSHGYSSGADSRYSWK